VNIWVSALMAALSIVPPLLETPLML